MTFNPNSDISGHRARSRGRGRTAAKGGGIGILGLLGLWLVGSLLGVDLLPFASQLGGGETTQSAPADASLEECRTGADANSRDDCRIAATTLVLDDYWGSQVEGYRAPEVVVVRGSTETRCGTASNAAGPFYCPPEETVYIDPTFFGLLRSQYGATGGELAQVYILAHEYGHHIQSITGILDEHPRAGEGADSNSVRTELQADCFAGAFVKDMSQARDARGEAFMLAPTKAQVTDALNAAASVGDDHIQSQRGRVNPETWTHGSSESREGWFLNGFTGSIPACDTFAVAGSDL